MIGKSLIAENVLLCAHCQPQVAWREAICLPTIPVWLWVTAVRLRQFGDFSNFSFRSVRFSLDSEWKALTWISVHEDLRFSPVYHHKQTACNNQFTHSVDPIQSQTEKLNPSYWHFIALTNLLCRQQQTCSPSTKQLLQTMTLTMLRSQTIVSPPPRDYDINETC